jgi:hypothetical protein
MDLFSEKSVHNFWSKVRRGSDGECWEWTASTTQSRGYGQFFPVRGKLITAHRYSFALANGGFPASGVCVCHTCDNRRCVNPAHLYAGTNKQNTRDMIDRGRQVVVTSKGEDHGMHKLTDGDVLEIRRIYSGRRGQIRELARAFFVDPSTVSLVVRGRTWRHLTETGVAA